MGAVQRSVSQEHQVSVLTEEKRVLLEYAVMMQKKVRCCPAHCLAMSATHHQRVACRSWRGGCACESSWRQQPAGWAT